MTEPEHQDTAIRQALQADAEHALDLIWDHHGALLFTLIAGIVGSHHDAEEVQQEVFIQIARQRGRVARANNLRAYLCAMARHAALSWLRSPQRREEPTDPHDFWLVASPEESRTEGSETATAIARALAELPEEQRTVVVLKLYQGLTFQEIAGILQIPLNTAASRYRYALEKLRPALSEVR
jgi:RNA polymerase sigma-70 factor, ECF subfamily